MLAEPETRVEAVRDDIHEGGLGHEVDRHVGKSLEKDRDDGLEQEQRNSLGCRDPKGSPWMILRRIDLGQRAVEIVQDRPQALDQARAEPRLQAAHHVAQGRRRHFQLVGGLPEAPVRRNRGESPQLGQ
jgi:hypothetical protein